MRTVYIEPFIADNFLMDYLLLFLTARILSQKATWWRLLLAACAGAAYAVAAAGTGDDFLNGIVCKFCVSVSLCLAAFGYTGFKTFVSQLFGMYVVTLFLAGSALLAVYMSGGSADLGDGLSVDSDAFRWVLGGILMAALLIGWIRNTLRRVNVREGLVRSIRVVLGAKSVELRAFLDTGNTMSGLFGEPVILAEREKIGNLAEGAAMRRLPYRTVAGESEVEAFLADEVVFLSGRRQSITGVLIAVYGGRLCADGSFGALLNPNLML
jgi:stage II sporulation protein GA (sporulation sigma-E factor processing peptidase)